MGSTAGNRCRETARASYRASIFPSCENHDQTRVAAHAPANWEAMKPGTSTGRIPEKVFVIERARVTAGLANDVDAVNQYALVMYAPTTMATVSCRKRLAPQITKIKPNVATNSLNICAPPARECCDTEKRGSPNIACAAATPVNAPIICAARYPGT